MIIAYHFISISTILSEYYPSFFTKLQICKRKKSGTSCEMKQQFNSSENDEQLLVLLWQVNDQFTPKLINKFFFKSHLSQIHNKIISRLQLRLYNRLTGNQHHGAVGNPPTNHRFFCDFSYQSYAVQIHHVIVRSEKLTMDPTPVSMTQTVLQEMGILSCLSLEY